MSEAQARSLISSHYRTHRIPLLDPYVELGMDKQNDRIIERELHKESNGSHFFSRKGEYALFVSLLITSSISSTLLVGDIRGWVLSSSLYEIVSDNRASVQIVVQLLSNGFALLQTTALCTLINRATRLRFSRTEVSMNDLQFWSHLCTPSVSWKLPVRYLIPLLSFIGLTMIPSALWAGALSPISVFKNHTGIVMVPSYENASLIREYPSEFSSTAQIEEVRNSMGVFSYRVGITMEGALLSTASSATTADGSPRTHVKLDNSGFTYIGRSYGVGSSAGLTDTNILDDFLTTSYTYQETGYNAKVQCIYNSSTEFLLYSDGASLLWEAIGPLPNSNGADERSTFIGRGDGPSIVAIGVAAAQTNGTQYMGIAAGSNYAFLNTTQCSINYLPTLFNITVGLKARNITVVPVSTSDDINPAGNIAHVSTRQLELISNDQTNLYQSLLGNSFMSSIGDYNISQSNSSILLIESTSTLAGLTNSISAMLDDILVGYASAQLMVGNQSTATEAMVTTLTLKIGQNVYIYAIFVFNLILVVIVLEEAIRTVFWRGLGRWDYMDIRDVVVSCLKGGRYFNGAVGEGFGQVREMKDGWIRGIRERRITGGDISGMSKLRFDRDTNTLVVDYGQRDEENWI